jgi:hypothetical protein
MTYRLYTDYPEFHFVEDIALNRVHNPPIESVVW